MTALALDDRLVACPRCGNKSFQHYRYFEGGEHSCLTCGYVHYDTPAQAQPLYLMQPDPVDPRDNALTSVQQRCLRAVSDDPGLRTSGVVTALLRRVPFSTVQQALGALEQKGYIVSRQRRESSHGWRTWDLV